MIYLGIVGFSLLNAARENPEIFRNSMNSPEILRMRQRRAAPIDAQAGGALTPVNPLIIQGVAEAMRVRTGGWRRLCLAFADSQARPHRRELQNLSGGARWRQHAISLIATCARINWASGVFDCIGRRQRKLGGAVPGRLRRAAPTRCQAGYRPGSAGRSSKISYSVSSWTPDQVEQRDACVRTT